MNHASNTWITSWIELEHSEKNIGIDYVINPTLYPVIINTILQTHEDASIYDFGCGTGSIAFDLLIRNPLQVPGLSSTSIQKIKQMRKKVISYTGYEREKELASHGNDRFSTYGLRNMNIVYENLIFQSIEESAHKNNIAISRNLLMQLSNKALQKHLSATAYLLGTNRYYVLSTLNPAYEEWKFGSLLSNGQEYEFKHGNSGELGSFTHCYRSRSSLETIFEAFFEIVTVFNCEPSNDDYIESHSRYYMPNIPMALVYLLKAK